MEIERKTITVEEAGRIIGVGRVKAYELVKAGKLPCLKLGPRKFVVPMSALDKYMERAGVA